MDVLACLRGLGFYFGLTLFSKHVKFKHLGTGGPKVDLYAAWAHGGAGCTQRRRRPELSNRACRLRPANSRRVIPDACVSSYLMGSAGRLGELGTFDASLPLCFTLDRTVSM